MSGSPIGGTITHPMRIRSHAIALVFVTGCPRPPEPVTSTPPIPEAAVESPKTGASAVDPACVTAEPGALADCVQPSRITADIEAVAGMRPPGSIHWMEVQHRCAEVFEASGFTVSLHDFGEGINVLGVREGTTRPEQRVLVGAHYDHIPGCTGADDNASGVAAVLEVARVLGPAPTARTVMVACWDAEEWRLRGSRAWVAGPMEEVGAPEVYLNFDAIAYVDDRPAAQRIPPGFSVLFPGEVGALADRDYRADFIAVVADPGAVAIAEAMRERAAGIGLPVALLKIPRLVIDSHLAVDLQRSDHAAFWDRGVPAIMVTDTADFRSDAYHCLEREDSVDTLDLGFAGKVVEAATFAAAVAASGSGTAGP